MPSSWRGSGLGKYAKRILGRRIQKTKVRAGRNTRHELLKVKADLIGFFEQEGLVRYEMLTGKKQQLRRNIGKTLSNAQLRVSRSRSYYVQNGYQLWDFKGEYWLDELGNYFYVGRRKCVDRGL